MIKTLFLASTAFATMTVAAVAADLPSRAVAPAFVSGTPWSGFYLGGQVGYGNAKSHADLTATGAAAPIFVSNAEPKGAVAGLHLGYNWALSGNFVLGVEGDMEAGFGKASAAILSSPSLDPISTYATNGEITWQGSLRGRLGYAFNNSLLVYGTGGLAFANYKLTSNFFPTWPTEYSQVKTGWAAGAGAEYALTSNLRGRVEYRYADFGTDLHAGEISAFVTHVPLTQHAVRVGVSYAFGAPAPVVAKY